MTGLNGAITKELRRHGADIVAFGDLTALPADVREGFLFAGFAPSL